MSDVELKLALEKLGYPFTKKFQASPDYLHRKIADMDVLISIGGNIANFNGYVEMNPSASVLWEKLSEACTVAELEGTLEEQFGIDHEKAVEDVLDFLNVLQEHQMVTVS